MNVSQNRFAAHQPALAQAAWPAEGLSGSLRALLLVVVGSLFLTAAAKIQVPFWPVQMSMQTFAVLVIGFAYGSRLGAATVAAYLAQGFMGLPVFGAAVAGPAYFAGPTGGYLVGFLLAATLLGLLAERGWDRTLPRALGAMALANVALYLPGLVWLAAYLGDAERAVAVGLVPFLLGDALKLALAAALVAGCRRQLDQA